MNVRSRNKQYAQNFVQENKNKSWKSQTTRKKIEILPLGVAGTRSGIRNISHISQDLKGHNTEFKLSVLGYTTIIYLPMGKVSSAKLAQDMYIPSHPNSEDSNWHFHCLSVSKESCLPLQIFWLAELFLLRMKLHELLSVDTNQYLGFWEFQVGRWLCDQKESLVWSRILTTGRSPHWQPQRFGWCHRPQIRHQDYFPSTNRRPGTLFKEMSLLCHSPQWKTEAFLWDIYLPALPSENIYLFINLFYEHCTSHTVQ